MENDRLLFISVDVLTYLSETYWKAYSSLKVVINPDP